MTNNVVVEHGRIVRICGRLSTAADENTAQGRYVSSFVDMTFQERLKKAAAHAKVQWGQTAVATSLGLKKQTVDRWFGQGEPKPAQLFLIADKWKVSARWLATEEGEMVEADRGATPGLTAREEILLHLYRGLFSLQQARLIQGLRALFDANQITRKELGQKPLRGVSDEEVERAFGAVPTERKAKRGARGPRRQLGDAMGDFLGDET